MFSPIFSSSLRAAFALLAVNIAATNAMAVEPTPPAPAYMAVDDEPNHHLIKDLGSYRIFDVEIPSGVTTAFHLHYADNFSVRVNESDITNETIDGKITQLKATPGSLTYGQGSIEKPYGHRLTTNSATAFRTIMIEVKKPLPASLPPAEALPADYSLVKETPRGRLYRLTLAAGQSATLPAQAADLLLVAQSKDQLSFPGSPQSLWQTKPGDFRFMPAHIGVSLKNEGNSNAEVSVLALF